MPKIAVLGDLNSDGGGAITKSATTVFAEGVLVARIVDSASPDPLCPILGGSHCLPYCSDGCPTVFAEGLAIHLHGGSRACGATTISSRATTFAGENPPTGSESLSMVTEEGTQDPVTLKTPIYINDVIVAYRTSDNTMEYI